MSVGFVLFAARAREREILSIDPSAPSHAFPHFWEKMFGSGRAILSLRDDYRQDLRAVKAVTGFEYVRFHAIFHDEVGLYNEDKSVCRFGISATWIRFTMACWQTECGPSSN